MEQHLPKIIAIVGPTATGKSDLAVVLAKHFNGEVLSVDSRQVYVGLDIGTGKITAEEMQGVPHHLLDIAHPSEQFSAATFAAIGTPLIADVLHRHHLPILCGGTGFYLDALLGTSLPEVPPNHELRGQLKELSLEVLQQKLATLDPVRFTTIDTKNRVRLVRAIEIASALGTVPILSPEKRYEVLKIGLTLPKEELEARIRTRLTARLEQGMIEEVEKLHTEGLTFERMEDLGLEYRYIGRYLQGKLTYEEMVESLTREIIRYAKRQMTWFKRDKTIRWIAPKEHEKAISLVENFTQPQRH